MAREKKSVHKVKTTEGKRNIIRQLIEEYDIESAQDIQDALKDILGGIIKEMIEAEMDDHLVYSSLNAQIAMIIVMAIKPRGLIAVMAAWKLKYHRIVSQHLNHKW